jgi:Domain of unknown function (DUF1707)
MSSRRDHLRAADVDRSYVADILKKACDEGRLSLHEYDERLQKTYTARTYGDLDKIILDLPRPSRRTGVQPYRGTPPVSGAGWAPLQQQQQQKDSGDWVRRLWMAWTIAVSVNVVVWVLVCLSTADFIYPWPVWVAGPWGAVLLVMTLMGRPKRQE